MDTSLSQSELDRAQAWKAYKSAYLKMNTAKSKNAVERISRSYDEFESALYTLFRGDNILLADISSLFTQSTNYALERVKPIIGRGPRMPKPDSKKEFAEGLISVQRNFRILAYFHRNNLRDELIASLEKNLTQAISSLRLSLQKLGPSKSGEAEEMHLQSMEDSVNAWNTSGAK